MGAEEALYRFQCGLYLQIRLQVMTRFPKTPNVAMNLALAVEAAQQHSQTIVGDGSRFHQQPQHTQHVHSQLAPEYLRTSGVAPMDLNAIQSRGPGQWRLSGHGGSNWRSQGKRPSALELKGVPSRTNPSFHRSLNVVEAGVPEVLEDELIDLSEDQDDESKALQQTLEEDKKYFDSLLSIKETDLPLYMMSCNGCSVNVMIDSGASGCYVAPKIVAGLPTRLVSNREVETAGDAQGYKHQIPAYVLDTKFDIILGCNWLKMVQPVPDWELDTWIIRQDKQAYVLHPTQTRHLPELAYLISHHQVQRLERYKKINDLFICYMHPNNDNDSIVFTRDGKQLMAEFPDVFQDKLPGLPPDRGIEHVIDTGDAVPISRPPYKISPLELDELKQQLKELLDLRLIWPSSSPWGAPVLFVRKAGDPLSGTLPSLRLCIEYHVINRVTHRINVPLPRIDECLERLHGMKYFSKLDLKSGYHQLRIQEDDIEKTSFNT
ncbi:hypothetical protein INT45_012706, partial [Circinella minor]